MKHTYWLDLLQDQRLTSSRITYYNYHILAIRINRDRPSIGYISITVYGICH